jgi:pre-mRNA-splicing factor SYF1
VLFRKRHDLDPKAKSLEDALKGHATLWQLYIDLELNFGSFDTIKIAFERCREHRSLTPLMLLNYTNFMWEHTYFEETFRVFEFALSNFKWPSLREIWLSYISKFITRHGGTAAGVERARSMFERLFRDIPKDQAGIFYFIYAEFEEKYGLYSHAVEIYDRMVRAVPQEEKFQAYSIYIAKVTKLLGVTKARPVFEAAVQNLPEKQVLVMGRKYAELEINLGEIERARGVMAHISQFTDPRDDSEGLWKEWEMFEVEYGDKDSYKEYLRIKRSVEAKYAMLPPDLEKMEEEVRKGMV